MSGEDNQSGSPARGSRKTGWTLGSVAALIIAVLAAWFGFGTDIGGSDTRDASASGSAVSSTELAAEETSSCPLHALPDQAGDVVSDIRSDGPFDYPDNDGTRFGNYEGLLPAEHAGFYREYTVETPGLDHRGARRIVTGGGTGSDPDVWYYTDDHYESFCEIPDAA